MILSAGLEANSEKLSLDARHDHRTTVSGGS